LTVFNIPYKDVNRFSRLIIDYIEKNKKIKPFINHFPDIDNFGKQIDEKKTHQIDRLLLIDVLESQNASLDLSDLSSKNIKLLAKENTFTVTTGHQLCLFTGPIYFIYKIISVINLIEKLKEEYIDYDFVPIFWMASEDHDFEEINHINLFREKIEWNPKNQGGPVGRMCLSDIDVVLNELKSLLPEDDSSNKIINLFEKAYLNNSTLANATRYIINEIFGRYGIVVIDGDDKRLKNKLIPVIKTDVIHKGLYDAIRQCTANLAINYNAQAHVRKINFFKLSDSNRILIDNALSEREIEDSAENFSPNVLIRPIYQELILPNIAMVGGASEIAYWMQLKTVFKQEKLPFPILVLRNSLMVLTRKQVKRADSLGFNIIDLFKNKDILKKEYIIKNSSIDISLSDEKKSIEDVYGLIINKTNDVGLKRNISAQLQNHLNSLDSIGSRLMRFEKEKSKVHINQISKLKDQLFPKNNLQERYDNLISFSLKDDDNFIEILKCNLNPLDSNFVVLLY